MAQYSVISDVCKTIVDLLQAEMVPEPIAQAEQIGVCDPHERGSCVVGVHIYDISEAGESRQTQPVVQPDGSLRNPGTALYLSMMVSVASKAEKETPRFGRTDDHGPRDSGAGRQQAPAGKVYAALAARRGETILVSGVPMELEEKTKIWTMFSESYKLSMFYKVGPVVLDSAVVSRPAERVREIRLGAEQKER